MARGWESKSVESQMESAREEGSAKRNPQTDEEKLASRQMESLLLSRAYVQRQLDTAGNHLYSQSLRQALADIDLKLTQLKKTLSQS